MGALEQISQKGVRRRLQRDLRRASGKIPQLVQWTREGLKRAARVLISRRYLARHADVRKAGNDAVLRDLKHGAMESRDPDQVAQDLQLITDSNLFDRDWYLARYADVREGGDAWP